MEPNKLPPPQPPIGTSSPTIPTMEAPALATMFGKANEANSEDAQPKPLSVAKLLPPPSAPRPPQSFMAPFPPNPQPPAGPQSGLTSKSAAEMKPQEPPQRNKPFPNSFGGARAQPSSMASKPPPGQGGPQLGPPPQQQRHRPLPRPGGNGPFGGPPGGGQQNKLPSGADRSRFGGPSPNQATSGGLLHAFGPGNGGDDRRGPPGSGLGGTPQMHAHPPGAGGPGQQRLPLQGGPPQNVFRGGPPGPPPGARPPQQGGPPPPGGGGMRELRVEDALVYLDDVKREFGDRPRIYNEFLEIMKNFKSQEVDTPGVINRVSKLFRGYNNLILGFNKFLPDGYKISLEDLERQDAEYARQQQSQQNQQQGPGPQGHAYSRPGAAPGSAPPGHLMNQQREGPPGHQGPAPGAIQGQGYAQRRPPQGQGGPHQQGPPATMNRPGPKPQGAASTKSMPTKPVQGMPLQPLHGGVSGNPPQVKRAPLPHQPPQQAPQHQAVEFDHAISYVTNIKKRFADDPNTYHQFLEILHTYQKEQRGIKEVLEQVASLFADHPDLLKEFTFFLPDAVQEQAKERLHRAAADSEERQRQEALAAKEGMEQPGYGANRTTWGGPRGLENRNGPAGRRISSQKFIDMTGVQQMETSEVIEQPPAQPRQPASGRKRPFSPGRETQTHHPEAYVYNSAVERQFFEAAKEALVSFSRDGGQAWAEFLKCLDMYAQELLSKTEMLNFVDQILGKRNAELFEEFKRILSAAGSPTGPTPSMEDSWYSVPLSEIDFFRCRQCSTSYRALPRDYPAPPCSDRSEEEKKILNDVWVSLPKGSEESYTFRHMRRNHCEEVLFRCEDERFEIDMVIDSNAATLRRLEPIADEIGQLAEDEKLVSDFSATGSKALNHELGLGGLRYQYTFDPTILGVIHRNSITRIYGEAGSEMLELIVKNPSVAVPVIVQRLRQKDREWKSARERLNRHWKELAEMNYYKSLDHRSLTWRTIDKRATSTRTLVAEIKDRAANGGKEGDAALTARREKSKEEHGSFFAVTMGDKQEQDLDLVSLPKAHPTIFTPQMSFMYDNNSWVQRDAYRILSFALERGSTSPADKERCHRLWRDLLGPLFGIPLSWMQKPAVAFQESTALQIYSAQSPVVVSNGEENSHDDDSDDEALGKNVVTEELKNRDRNHDKSSLMDNHPLAAGTIVSTVYGEGRILRFRRSDKCYEVDLPFGTGFLQPNTVLCTVERVEQSAYTNQLKDQDATKLAQKDDFLCFGTQSLYLFFRLHQILIRRLNIAKRMAYHVVKDQSLHTLVEQMKAEPNEDIGRKRYEAYLSLVYALVDGGQSDAGGKYEDRVRCLLGHGAYELATMDKLLSHILKNLQSISHDHIMLNLVALFRRHSESGCRPEAFKQEAACLSEGDNMFAFQLSRVPETDKKVLHMEFLGVIYQDDANSQGLVEPEPEPAAKRPRVRA